MKTEFKINVADVAKWRQQPETLRSLLNGTYSQFCVAYSMWDSAVAAQYAEAMFIGEALYEFCNDIFPIHVYQPGSTPTDHIVFILQIRDLDAFFEKLCDLGDLFDGNASKEQAAARIEAINRFIDEFDTRELHFPELRDSFHQHQSA